MDPIKEAFSKIKKDILFLRKEIESLRSEMQKNSFQQTTPTYNPTDRQPQTDKQTGFPTHNYPLEPLYPQNKPISIGNRGVPTDRQTDEQTNQQTNNSIENTSKSSYNPEKLSYTYQTDPIYEFRKANEILESLDDIKKGIRAKFKALTSQEMLVFSTLYSLQEQNVPEITYKLLANKLTLSESSIRDYTNKLIKKGVPIEKIRQNNKTIVLKISQDLQKVATLDTIMHLREL